MNAAAIAIAAGLGAQSGVIEGAALIAAVLMGLALTALAARFREPETLILFGVAISSFSGALTSLVFNLATGLVGRAMPSFQIYFAATPLQVLLGFSLFALSFGVMGNYWLDRYRDLLSAFG